MRTVGIIAEYNPFHTGHAHHLELAKKRTGADFALVVMSPDFVQRGEPAVFDKYTRTKMALLGGADVVLELPLRYATGSAEYFAEGAVSLLDSLGVIDALCFGGESENLKCFLQTARTLIEEPTQYAQTLQEHLKRGVTFPQARSEALCTYLGKNYPCRDYRTFLASPNNILGIEYCRALLRCGSSVMPVPVKREGNDYNSPKLEGTYSSATALRRQIANEKKRSGMHGASSNSNAFTEILQYVPESCRFLFIRACETACFPDAFLPFLDLKLLSQDSFTHILDITPDLSDRILNKRMECIGKSWEETVGLLKTKQITEARIRRTLLHLLLDIRRNAVERLSDQPMIPYARLLGFRTTAIPLLHEIKQNSRCPLISKNANARKLLPEISLQMWDQDIAASHLYRSVISRTYHIKFQTEYEMSPIVL